MVPTLKVNPKLIPVLIPFASPAMNYGEKDPAIEIKNPWHPTRFNILNIFTLKNLWMRMKLIFLKQIKMRVSENKI